MKETVEVTFKDSLNGGHGQLLGCGGLMSLVLLSQGLLIPVPCSVGQ